jgi:tRNA-uridine 2-sulfurtransferase
MEKKIKVMIGLSGGVDSAVAAFLLKEQGYDVVAGFMRNWDAFANNDFLGNPTLDDPMCPQEKDYDDAKAVADKLGIKLFRADFIKAYWDDVFTYFLKEYERGRTPNPDIFCNKYIKFAAFRTFAKDQGCDYIAMGHYAKKIDRDGLSYMLKSHDQNKDQTYFLSQISQEQLHDCLFPLGDIDKPEVRRIAKKLGLAVAEKKDSTGVCFIGERNFKQFLQNYLPAHQGPIKDINTHEQVGKHDGVLYYTIGQRRGLGIGGIAGHEAKSWFVVKKDVKKNILWVANGNEDEHLLSDTAIVRQLNWISGKPQHGQHVGVKFRYRQKDAMVTLFVINDDTVKVVYDVPQKAVTTGQGAVFYDGEVCLGGGLIDEVYYKNQRIDLPE